jgi:hypothetical protein
MIDTKEALGRIALAELETRHLKERSAKNSRRWRLMITIARVIFAFAVGVYLQVSHWQTGAQVCGFFLVYFASAAWEEYRTREMMRSLQIELERLKDEIEAKAG